MLAATLLESFLLFQLNALDILRLNCAKLCAPTFDKSEMKIDYVVVIKKNSWRLGTMEMTDKHRTSRCVLSEYSIGPSYAIE